MLLKLQICSGVRDVADTDPVDSTLGSGSGSGSGEPISDVGGEYENNGVGEEEKEKVNDDEGAASLLSSSSPSSSSTTTGCRLEIRWSLCKEDVGP